jgi:hypothetical protein
MTADTAHVPAPSHRLVRPFGQGCPGSHQASSEQKGLRGGISPETAPRRRHRPDFHSRSPSFSFSSFLPLCKIEVTVTVQACGHKGPDPPRRLQTSSALWGSIAVLCVGDVGCLPQVCWTSAGWARGPSLQTRVCEFSLGKRCPRCASPGRPGSLEFPGAR